MAQKVKIVGFNVENEVVDIGRELSARTPAHARYRYYVKATYIGEGGEEFPAKIRGLTKPKLKQRIDDNRRYVAQGMMQYEKSTFDDSWFQVISFTIGASVA
jgi:hypothetical protein